MEDSIKKGKRFVVAAISVKLCEQILEDFSSSVKTNLLVSETVARMELVSDRFIDALKEKVDDVVVITHNTLLRCYDKLNAEGWDIIVDELPNIHTSRFMKVHTLEDDTLARWLTYTESGVDTTTGYRSMELRTGFEDKLKDYLQHFEDVSEEESYINKSGYEGLKGILSGDSKVLRKQTEDDRGNITVEYAFNSVYNPDTLFKGFEEVIFLCADFHQQLTGLLFKHKFNIEVEDKPEIILRKDNYDNPERIKIYPLIKAPTIFSSKLSKSWYDPDTNRKYPEHMEWREGLVEFFQHMIDTASSIVGEEGYIYTVNKFRTQMIEKGDYPFLQESDKVKRLKYNPHGLNHYMDYSVAMGLFCCNPKPIQRVLLRELDKECQVKEGTFEKGYAATAMNDPIFQLVTRSKIRNFEELEDIICIVPDYRSAEYLVKGWFRGATIVRDYEIEISEGKSGAPKKWRGLFNMNDAEYKAFTRWCNKQLGMKQSELKVDNKNDYEIVKEWVDDKRTP